MVTTKTTEKAEILLPDAVIDEVAAAIDEAARQCGVAPDDEQYQVLVDYAERIVQATIRGLARMSKAKLGIFLVLLGFSPFTVDVANRCAGEAGGIDGGVFLCSCTVGERLNRGWKKESVLRHYYAGDEIANEDMLAQAESGLDGVGCPRDAYFLFSREDLVSLGLNEDCATGKSGDGKKAVFSFPYGTFKGGCKQGMATDNFSPVATPASPALPSLAEPDHTRPRLAVPSPTLPRHEPCGQMCRRELHPPQASHLNTYPCRATPRPAKPSHAEPSQAVPSQATPRQALPRLALL